MKKIVLFIFIVINFTSHAQKNIYQSDKFENLSKNHKVLAILPFLTNLELKETISTEDLNLRAKKEGYAVQNALETYFSKRKKKKKFTIEFQNTQNTNAILAKNNITYKNIDVYTIKELSEILNVDGIIGGTLDLNVLLSKGVSNNFNFFDFILGNGDYGRIGIKISDGNTGKLLWKYEKKINKKSGKDTADLIDKMMKLASRKFPYEREKKKDKKKKNEL